jgi:Uma2 family endonuclease
VTIEEWLAVPEEARAELIGGRLVYQGMPGPRHGRAQGTTFSLLRGPYDRKPGDADRPGGWWLSQEVDMFLGGIGCRPDLVGWRRETCPRLPEPDARGVVTDVPDWICEVLSPGTRRTDWGSKRVAYHQAGVPFYWLLDPDSDTLTVLRRAEEAYLIVLVAAKDDVVRAPPFDALELAVWELLGKEREAPAAPEAEVAGGQQTAEAPAAESP